MNETFLPRLSYVCQYRYCDLGRKLNIELPKDRVRGFLEIFQPLHRELIIIPDI